VRLLSIDNYPLRLGHDWIRFSVLAQFTGGLLKTEPDEHSMAV